MKKSNPPSRQRRKREQQRQNARDLHTWTLVAPMVRAVVARTESRRQTIRAMIEAMDSGIIQAEPLNFPTPVPGVRYYA